MYGNDMYDARNSTFRHRLFERPHARRSNLRLLRCCVDVYFGNIATPVWFTVISILTGTLVIWPVIRLRAYSHLTLSAADRAFWASIAKPYWINFAIEWVLCSVATYWLSRYQHYDLIPHFLGVIIGLHFLPLGKIFKVPLYYATGVVMVVGVLATLAIPAGYARNIAACGINGLALWATAAVLLYQDGLSSRKEENGNDGK